MKLAIFAYSRRGCETAIRIRGALCAPADECRCFAPAKYAGGAFQPIVPPYNQFTGPLFA